MSEADEINSRVRVQKVWPDSPVMFPAEGPLPARWVPDGEQRDLSDEPPYELHREPRRSAGQVEAIRHELGEVRFSAQTAGLEYLEETRAALRDGKPLRVLALGDSIVNDLMRSGWVHPLAAAYPASEIVAYTFIRGGGNCGHYAEGDRLARVVTRTRPGLVFIGGISSRSLDEVREVLRKLRAAQPKVEIVLSTGAFGSVDPRDAQAFAAAPHSGTGEFGRGLRKLAGEEKVAFLDMASAWAEAMESTRQHPHVFYRDPIHANELGEQILALILGQFFQQVNPPASAPR